MQPGIANFLSYFVPALALAEADSGVMTAMDIGASSGNHGELLCVRACRVKRLQFTLTEEAAGGTSAAPIVTFKKRPTPLSSTGESTIGTLTIPDGTAIGKTVYKDIDPVALAVGETVHLSWTIGSGTPTGIGIASFICEDAPEEPANNSDMIESA